MDLEKETISQCLKIIRYFAHKKGLQEFEDNKISYTIELLRHIKVLIDKKATKTLQKLINENIFNIMRNFLIDPKPIIRQNAIKFFRYLMDSTETLELYKKKHIPFFIAKSLERDTREKDSGKGNALNPGGSIIYEIIQNVKFVRKWIEISPKTFPKMLANSLVSFAESSDDQLKKAAIETLKSLALGIFFFSIFKSHL